MRTTQKLLRFLRGETVLCVSALAALLALLFARPTAASCLDAIDWGVLALLFCLMAVTAGLQRAGLLEVLSQRLVGSLTNTKALRLTLILLCFFSSMLLTNDVALITFVPFAIAVLGMTGQSDRLLFVVVMQTAAANLGSMLTPFGNPQNLYLFTRYGLRTGEFLRLTAPLCAVGLLLIIGLSLILEGRNVHVVFARPAVLRDRPRLVIYLLLFAACLLGVLHLLPWEALLLLVVGTLLLADRTLLARVDYGLLGTFVCFFLFAGSLGGVPAFRELVSTFLAGRELLCGILLSQVISNVPAAVLLSGFTDNAAELVQGTNLGGLGTLIASLASLISFKLYARTEGARPLRYLALFTAVNLLLLLALYEFARLW